MHTHIHIKYRLPEKENGIFLELLILFSHSNCFWSPCCGTIAVWGTQKAENRGENEKICARGVHVLKNGADYNERDKQNVKWYRRGRRWEGRVSGRAVTAVRRSLKRPMDNGMFAGAMKTCGRGQEQPMKILETTDLPNGHPMKIPETAGLLLR